MLVDFTFTQELGKEHLVRFMQGHVVRRILRSVQLSKAKQSRTQPSDAIQIWVTGYNIEKDQICSPRLENITMLLTTDVGKIADAMPLGCPFFRAGETGGDRGGRSPPGPINSIFRGGPGGT